jgi:hypothetical protein
MLASYGVAGPATLAPPDPVGLCAAIEALLGDARQRDERAAAGLRWAATRTWAAAAAQVEAGLRAALREAAPA